MAISAKQVKDLRDKTGAAMMDCKRALQDADGDMDRALVVLREKGLARAGKKASRTTKEGVISCYVHPNNKLGVLVEVACETDFVARTDDFQDLVKEVSLQIAAMKPSVVSREELDQDELERERGILAKQAEGKPAQVIEKIVDGRMQKYFSDVCLMDQPYIRDDSKTIQDLVKEVVGRLGENIEIRRFAVMEVGQDE